MGVLHHTKNCKKAFKKISNYVKNNGYLYVGLYHLYGRKPMLDYLQSHSRWFGEDSAFNLFRRMTNDTSNLEHTYSWFRDQVLHPHETQHTLKEVREWLKEIDFKLISTSINNYKPLENYSDDELFKIELDLERESYERNVLKNTFTPGYLLFASKNLMFIKNNLVIFFRKSNFLYFLFLILFSGFVIELSLISINKINIHKKKF